MIKHIEKDMETIVEHHTCGYHKLHPENRDYAGCTCSSLYGLERKR